jgi:hypothetical protein
MSALTEAMRKKYRTPKDAVRALGLDEALLALDSAEAVKMPTQFASTTALLVGTAIRPLLKPKAKVDLMPVFKDLTADGFDAKEFQGALDEALKGKLVKGADLKLAYDNFMPHVEGMAKGSDESVSAPQHAAMEAAAHGNSTLGIPQSVGKEFAEADKGKNFGGGDGYDAMFMKKAMDWMKSKGMDAAMSAEFAEHMGKPPAQDSEEEEPEEVTQGHKNVVQHAEDRPPARDMRRADDRRADDRRADDRRADDRRADDGDAHHAMDSESINKRIDDAVRAREQNLKARFAAAENAKKWIGAVDPMAFDSDVAIKQHVLKTRGYKRWNTIHPDAMDDVLATIPQIGMRPVERMAQDSKFGIDETRRADAVKLAPGLANIRIGV